MTKTTYTKNGRMISEAEALDNGRIKDGVTITRHSMLMDGSMSAAITADMSPPQMHRPGFIDRAPADEMKLIVKRAAKDAALRDAWQSPPSLDDTQIGKPKAPSVTGNVYDRRDARLRNAWRTA